MAVGVPGALAAPPNDDFANAQVLSGAFASTAGSLAGATKQDGEPVDGGATVWYRWTAPLGGRTRALACAPTDSSTETALDDVRVFLGDSLVALSRPAGSKFDRGVPCTDVRKFNGSFFDFDAVPGATYSIAAVGSGESDGPPPPAFFDFGLSVTQDSTAPQTKLKVRGAGPPRTEVSKPYVSVLESGSDPGPSSGIAKLECKIDNGPYRTCARSLSRDRARDTCLGASPTLQCVTWLPFQRPGRVTARFNGIVTHVVRARATDRLGNVDPTPATLRVRVRVSCGAYNVFDGGRPCSARLP